MLRSSSIKLDSKRNYRNSQRREDSGDYQTVGRFQVTKPGLPEARENVRQCFHCSFILSMNTDSGTVKHKILEEVDLSLNRIKLICASEDAYYLLFVCYRLKCMYILILNSENIHKLQQSKLIGPFIISMCLRLNIQ